MTQQLSLQEYAKACNIPNYEKMSDSDIRHEIIKYVVDRLTNKNGCNKPNSMTTITSIPGVQIVLNTELKTLSFVYDRGIVTLTEEDLKGVNLVVRAKNLRQNEYYKPFSKHHPKANKISLKNHIYVFFFLCKSALRRARKFLGI